MKKKSFLVLAFILTFFLVQVGISFAEMEPFIGEIAIWSGNFAPKGWHFCDGSLLPIASNTALFSILGTTYGGNGVTNFALPDLRGRVPIGAGMAQYGRIYNLGEMSGVATTYLTTLNLPPHTHNITCSVTTGNTTTVNIPASTQYGNTDTPGNNTSLAKVYDATGESKIKAYTTNAADATLKPIVVNNIVLDVNTTASLAGAGQPFTNMQPYLGVNYIIALQGIFPPRS